MFKFFSAALTLLICTVAYLSFAVCKLEIISKHLPESRWKCGFIGAGIVLAIFAVLYFSMDFFNAYVCITLSEFLKDHKEPCGICVLGHFLFAANGDYWSFFDNDQDKVVCVWYF